MLNTDIFEDLLYLFTLLSRRVSTLMTGVNQLLGHAQSLWQLGVVNYVVVIYRQIVLYNKKAKLFCQSWGTYNMSS